MNTQQEAISALFSIPAPSVCELGRALSHGTLRHGYSLQSLSPFVGERAPIIHQALKFLSELGHTSTSLGLLCEGVGNALLERDSTERSLQLILSGPELTGIPVMDTKTTVMSLFEEAVHDVLITSYVFYDAAEFFELLAKRHDSDKQLRVRFVVDLTHKRASLAQPLSLIAQAFIAEFQKKHWPGERLPEIWHDSRQFELSQSGGGVMHAKTVIVDRKSVFITSANFTGAAQSRNIEVGILLRQPRTAARLHSYFLGLMDTQVLRQIA
jgi:hypothetical protein